MATSPEIIRRAPPPSGSIYTTNPNYQIVLDVEDTRLLDSAGGKLFPMVANLPEKFSFGMGSQWSTPFDKANEIVEAAADRAGIVGSAAKAGMAATGTTFKSKATSAQVWQSSDPMTFSIPFVFVANKNPITEVRDKIRALLKLVAPTELTNAGIGLSAPGPTIAGQAADGFGFSKDSRKTTLIIGRLLTLSPIIITSVQCDMDAIFHSSGAPMFATVNVEVQSFFSCFTTNDIDAMFSLSQAKK